jgi:hypothetical protein
VPLPIALTKERGTRPAAVRKVRLTPDADAEKPLNNTCGHKIGIKGQFHRSTGACGVLRRFAGFAQKARAMINGTKTAASLGADIERLSSRTIAAVTARLAIRFCCFAEEPDHAKHVIRRLSHFAGVEAAEVGPLPRPALPKYAALSERGARVIERCGQVLGEFNKHANWHDTDDMLAELSARLLDAMGAALEFEPREGGGLIDRAVRDDLAAAGHVGNSSLDAHDVPFDPSERGPLGILWPDGPPKWWRAAE